MASAGVKCVRILGVDTSLRSTGFAVVAEEGSRMSAVEYGAIRTPAKQPLSECLRRLSRGLNEVIERTHPQAAAIEGVFFSKNANTAVVLGEARGVVIAVCAERNIPVYEYAPRRVKQAVVGFGAAEKEQVRKMVVSLLHLSDEPQEDAGDALAIAICHLHNKSGVAMLTQQPI